MMSERAGRPLFIVDIGVPRNVEPRAGRVAGMTLCNIDDLAGVVERNLGRRREEAAQVEAIVEEELAEFELRMMEREERERGDFDRTDRMLER